MAKAEEGGRTADNSGDNMNKNFNICCSSEPHFWGQKGFVWQGEFGGHLSVAVGIILD